MKKRYSDIMYDLTNVANVYSREEGCRGLKFRHMVEKYFKENEVDAYYQEEYMEEAMDIWQECYLS